jgi:hypothetical protein
MAAADGGDDSQATLIFGEGDGPPATVANPLEGKLPYPVDHIHLKIGKFFYTLDEEDHIIPNNMYVNFNSSAVIF